MKPKNDIYFTFVDLSGPMAIDTCLIDIFNFYCCKSIVDMKLKLSGL